MNINQKFIINIISIINSIIAIILLTATYITSINPDKNSDIGFWYAMLILAIIYFLPILILQVIKFIFIKLNWNMLVCVVICCMLEAFFLLMYLIMGFLLTISPTEPY